MGYTLAGDKRVMTKNPATPARPPVVALVSNMPVAGGAGLGGLEERTAIPGAE